MWTPRRILYLIVAFVASGAVFAAYNRVLGVYDGLPPLPLDYLHKHEKGTVITRPNSVNVLDKKLELAFGPNCRELRMPVKLEVKSKQIVFACENHRILQEGPRKGWLELTPLSVAVFGKKRGPDGTPEINKLYCDIAYIKFDKPLRTLNDLEGSKIDLAELHAQADELSQDTRKGRVLMGNNRRTIDDNDDLEFQTPGPVYYKEFPVPGKPHIFTTNAVQVVDHQNTNLPKPDRKIPRLPTVTGIGMRVYLTREEPRPVTPPKIDPKTAFARKKQDLQPGPLSGVELIELDNTVEMNLWTAASSGLVGGDPPPPPMKLDPPTTSPNPTKDVAVVLPPKKLLQIKTNGPFRYDMPKELAHFEKPKVQKPNIVEHVTVARDGRAVGQDMLDCDYLDVFLTRRKTPPPNGTASPPPTPANGKKEDSNGDLQIKSLHAWGEIVTMTSDSENLRAHGVDLTHDAEQRVTILKGSPEMKVQVVKDGNLLHGNELHLFGDGKEFSQAHILGPGSLGMGDIDPKTNTFFKQASWVDRLVFTKQVEKDRTLDVLTFVGKPGVGKAIFRDASSGETQHLEGYQLKVWLLPKNDAKTPTPKVVKKDEPKSDGLKGSKPQRLEATGDVKSISADIIIRQADYLNVWFQDVPKLIKPKTPEAKATAKLPEPREVGLPAPKEPPPVVPPAKNDPKVVAKQEPKKEPQERKEPLYVVAKTIETWVNRDPTGATEMDRVHAEGDVDVHQNPTASNPQGTDISGATLDLKTYAEGNYLHVTGDPISKPRPGYVAHDKLKMYGPDIVIDQRANTSQIKGEGSMEILSASDLEGKKLDKPTTMTIYWKHRMDFYGPDKVIYYHGAVQAYQEASRVRCEWMQVVLDRPVYLTQERDRTKATEAGQPKKDSKESPKVDTILCFHAPKDDEVPRPKVLQPVTVTEEVKENGRIVKFTQIQSPEVVSESTPANATTKKEAHTIRGTASDTMPGVVRIWQAGSKDAGFVSTKDPAPKKDAPPRKKGELGSDEEMKLTYVQYSEKMIAHDLRKRAIFYGNIKVVHFPAERHNVAVNLREGDIPKGAIYMDCRKSLQVSTKTQIERDMKGQEVEVGYQEMEAIGNVRVRKQGEFFGDADMVTYSELKGVLTFYGTKMNPAMVTQEQGQGVKSKTIESEKIFYYTKTKTFQAANATTLMD